MKSAGLIGMKITAAAREYFRYTGLSAELERRGLGSSRAELAWAQQEKKSQAPIEEPTQGIRDRARTP